MEPKTRTLHEGRHVRLMIRGEWEYIERTRSSMAAIIVAVTPEGELLLVEQYRPALDSRVIELPAGLVADEADGEELEAAAARELEEETGYSAARIDVLTQGPPSPGLDNEEVAFVVAHDLTQIGEGGGVPGENIVVHRVKLENVATWLEARRASGVLVDPKIYAGLYFVSAGC